MVDYGSVDCGGERKFPDVCAFEAKIQEVGLT